MRRLVMLLCLLALTIIPTIAQTDETETWEVIERCVDEPVEPPDDWSFEGVIYTYGDTAIRGLRHDISATFITVYAGENFLTGATFSPNGQYIAVPAGFTLSRDWYENQFRVTEIRIYETALTRRLVQRLPVFAITQFSSSFEELSITQVYWLDDIHIYYRDRTDPIDVHSSVNVVINIETGEKTIWSHDYHPAEYSLEIHDLMESPQVAQPYPVWISDSQAIIGRWENFDGSLSIISPDAVVQQIIFGGAVNSASFNLSPNSQYLAFIAADNRLFIADLMQETIYDTCLTYDYGAFWRHDNDMFTRTWSPNSTQIAINLNDNVVILDMESWQAFNVHENFGAVMAWLPVP